MASAVRSIARAFTRWIDSYSGGNVVDRSGPDRIEWMRSMPFLLIHLTLLTPIWVGWSWAAVWTCVTLYFARMFFITGFYHRYFSHRSFKTSRAFQFLMALAGATAVQRGPLWWASHHRHHHKHSDGPEDVHSPHQHSFVWSHIGWICSKSNFATDLKAVPDLAKYPELVWLDRFDTVIPILFASAIFFFGMWLGPEFGTSGAQMLAWGFGISTVFLVHGTCSINSMVHLVGKQRFNTGDKSKNSLLFALITLGEGWHNNHHHYQACTSQGFRWYEIDITYYLLRFLGLFGLVHSFKPVPKQYRGSSTPPAESAHPSTAA